MDYWGCCCYFVLFVVLSVLAYLLLTDLRHWLSVGGAIFMQFTTGKFFKPPLVRWLTNHILHAANTADSLLYWPSALVVGRCCDFSAVLYCEIPQITFRAPHTYHLLHATNEADSLLYWPSALVVGRYCDLKAPPLTNHSTRSPTVHLPHLPCLTDRCWLYCCFLLFVVVIVLAELLLYWPSALVVGRCRDLTAVRYWETLQTTIVLPRTSHFLHATNTADSLLYWPSAFVVGRYCDLTASTLPIPHLNHFTDCSFLLFFFLSLLFVSWLVLADLLLYWPSALVVGRFTAPGHTMISTDHTTFHGRCCCCCCFFMVLVTSTTVPPLRHVHW
jgi:hypothetical protein